MANFQDSPCYSSRFIITLQYVAEIHNRQIRKQGGIPYISHLLQFCGLVFEAGGSEDEVIAALLHDAVEDVEIPLEDIGRWGVDVAQMVGNLTECKTTPKEQRKAEYINNVKMADSGTILVSCADKLHNLRCYAADGQHLWSEATADFYAQLLPIYRECKRVPRHWIDEMEQKFLILNFGS